ncbi:hypothetical protein P6F26_14810, partial [Roseibacterium sp. SDUM158017]|nr:hypothetical protein [Roseibacterium sp. SDUM158017]
PGTYELRYIASQDRTALATRMIEVTPVAASLAAPDTAVAGASTKVAWQGPDYDGDYIAVSRPGDDGYETFAYTREGAPLDLVMPSEPGAYELRYVVGQDRTVIATRPISVTPP